MLDPLVYLYIVIVILGTFIVYSGLLCLIVLRLEKKVSSAYSVSNSIRYRRRFKFITWFVAVLYPVTSFLLLYYDVFEHADYMSNNLMYYKLMTTVLCILLSFILFRYQVIGFSDASSSIYSIDSVLKKKRPFILYLRGFGSDNYLPKVYLSKFEKRRSFSESLLAQNIKLFDEFITVGRPQELYCPIGASRVYLEDSTWQSDVLKMMEKADKIVILVNDRPSCIWEAEQSREFVGKTFFIISNEMRMQFASELFDSLGFRMGRTHTYPVMVVPSLGEVIRFENNKRGYLYLGRRIASFANIRTHRFAKH